MIGLVDVSKMKPRPLYVRRDVLNGEEIRAWAQAVGIVDIAEDLHVTIIHSKVPMDWLKAGEPFYWGPDAPGLVIQEGGPRAVSLFGEGALVIEFASDALKSRNETIIRAGASTDFPEYKPHITVSTAPQTLDPATIPPYRGKIVLGPEIFEDIRDEGIDDVVTITAAPVEAVIVAKNDEQRIVYGWASVIAKDAKGVPLYDSQGDRWASEAELELAATDFMKSAREAKAMHNGPGIGDVIHSLPVTTELAKALGIQTSRSGWIIGVFVKSDAVWARVKSGELAAFSIAGQGKRTIEETPA